MTALPERESVIWLTVGRRWSASFWAGTFFVIAIGAMMIEFGVPNGVAIVGLLFTGDQVARLFARREINAFIDSLRREGGSTDRAAVTRAWQAVPYRWPDSQPWPRKNRASAMAAALRHAAPAVHLVEVTPLGSAELPSLTPFEHLFEPTLLRRSDPAFRALSDLPVDSAQARLQEVADEIIATMGRHWTRVIGAIFLFGIVFLAVDLLVHVVTSGVGGIRDVVSTWWLGIPLLVVGCRRLLWPEEWLLVPGGVLIRRGDWRSSRWKLIELRRETGTLVCDAASGSAGVASGEMEFGRRCSPVELQALTRAWLSDAPRQPLERMTDLQETRGG